MKCNKKLLIGCIAVPLIIGVISSLLTMGQMKAFEKLDKPPLSPPGWVFPVVWSILFILMGIASYLILCSNGGQEDIEVSLRYYGIQLLFNLIWSVLFFNFKLYFFSFIWLLVLLALIIITAIKFYHLRPAAGYLLIPYILWVTFAGYLNLGIAILN